MKHDVFGRDGREFIGKDVALVSDWLTKKVFKRSVLKMAGTDDDCSLRRIGNEAPLEKKS